PKTQSSNVASSRKEEVPSPEEVEKKERSERGRSSDGGAFYSTRVFATDRNEEPVRSRFDKAETLSKDAVKGGVAVFPPSLMAEIAGMGGGAEKVTRSEVNRSPNPTVKERLREASLTPTHKATFDYTTSAPTRAPFEYNSTSTIVDTPQAWGSYSEDRMKRAKSAGPPRVSRMEDSASNEAQFIFRAHGADENGGNYRMTSSVYNPIAEIERMRHMMNKQMDSRATTPSIYSCNTSRMSTPALYAREEDRSGVRHRGRSCFSRGSVGATARSWPPPTNAEGADIGKEAFIDGDGVITTACTRIVQKRNEESWRWFDDNGRMMDEKKEFTIMGDRDELTRGGPWQANQTSQHYYIDRDGTTRFENIHRQYDRDYVVESEWRNY
ncbi:hypothetical protein PFISCL1PPCAC_464, partial [Pristionchus fissidentatus]